VSTHLKTVIFVTLGTTALLFGCATTKPLADACLSPLSPAIKNSCVVTPNSLWRGEQPSTEGANALISLGVKTVVNLELLHDDRAAFHAARSSTELVTYIDYFRIPDWEPNAKFFPELLDAHVANFIAIVKTQEKPIYVHCRSGQNRTGVMVAAYRVLVEGVSIESAIAEVQRYKGVWFDSEAKYLRSLTDEHRKSIEKLIEVRIAKVTREARFECFATGCKEKK